MKSGRFRNNYFDFLRGVAILMVIAIHTSPAFDFDTYQGWIDVGIRQIFNCAVPLFFAISGYFLGSKNLEDKSTCLAFWKHQIPKVYIPVLIWSLPYLFLSLYSNSASVLKPIICYLICGYSVYYFILVIIQIYVFLPIIQKVQSRKKLLVISCLLSVLSIVFLTYILQVKNISLPLVGYAGHALLWGMFFVLGVYLKYSRREYSWKKIFVGCLFLWILQIFEAHYWFGYSGGGFGIKLSSFVFSAAVVILLFSKNLEKCYTERNRFVFIIRKVGNYSFGIYLIHCFVILFLGKLNVSCSWPLKWLIVGVTSACVVGISRIVLPRKINQILGF